MDGAIADSGDTDNEVTTGEAAKGDEETEELVAKKNTSGPVWKYFGFEADETGKPWKVDHPRCRVCYQEVGAKDGNTSN